MLYVVAKHKDKLERDNYMFDMLWAIGSGMTFKKYPRWHELKSKPQHVEFKKSSEEMISDVINKFKGGVK